MPTVRVMFVGQGASLLPEDRFVNVFHFHDPTLLPPDPAIADAIGWVSEFYNSPTVGGTPLGAWISPYVQRPYQLIGYNMLEAKPRVPHPSDFTLPAAVGGGMPEEVAVCLSITGAPPITARRRGRIYFGPLSNAGTAVDPGTSSSPSRPSQDGASDLLQSLVSAGKRLMDDSTAGGLPWSIRSVTPSENYVTVTGGYVDNAFDTQRRRGPDPTGRLHFDGT